MSQRNRKYYSHRGSGWKCDLPGPNEPPIFEPDSEAMSYSPNFMDETYLEMPRATLKARGLIVWLTIMCMPLFICGAWLLAMLATDIKSMPLQGYLIIVFTITVVGWEVIYSWRMDTEAPVDEPIRFNRSRRKIYVYRFRYNGLKPFSRTDWGVYPEVFDWDTIKAEFCSLYGPMGTGGLVEFVNLVVVEPGTGEVLDRFVLAHGREHGEMYWTLAQLYMQQGPEAIPKFDRPPRDWNNETHFENIARRLAPKVKWPEAMDVESRSAP